MDKVASEHLSEVIVEMRLEGCERVSHVKKR